VAEGDPIDDDDAQLRREIFDEVDPRGASRKIFTYYHHPERARAATRELLLLHLGLLTGFVERAYRQGASDMRQEMLESQGRNPTDVRIGLAPGTKVHR
jgi:hypothetical protein